MTSLLSTIPLYVLFFAAYAVSSPVGDQSDPSEPPYPPVCTTCRDGVLALKKAIPSIANFARITIGTIIDKVCNHLVPEFDFLEAICHVLDRNVEERIYSFLMALHDKVDEKYICHLLNFCPR